jgi:hypothetical protein
MEYISLIVNEDAAHDCLADLGKLGVIQFTDVRAQLAPSLAADFADPCQSWQLEYNSCVFLFAILLTYKLFCNPTVEPGLDSFPTSLCFVRQALR